MEKQVIADKPNIFDNLYKLANDIVIVISEEFNSIDTIQNINDNKVEK